MIVGAGSAGLTVCAALTAHGCNCTVLAASDRVGGRLRTLDGARGLLVDDSYYVPPSTQYDDQA